MVDFKSDIVKGEVKPEMAAQQRDDRSPEMLRREFLKRFGVYAAGSAVGLYVLMSAKTSAFAEGDDGGGY